MRVLAWHLRVGRAWRALPPGLMHWRTVYGWLRRWQGLGLLDALPRHVTALSRRAVGRKRVALVDADGTWLAIAVVLASV